MVIRVVLHLLVREENVMKVKGQIYKTDSSGIFICILIFTVGFVVQSLTVINILTTFKSVC